ncbi:hypothetical protein FDECE_13686 [Fusarium decemcellulare]|nr:hypothetical protein FDECE_13686 [Fusarium decemcellulare]
MDIKGATPEDQEVLLDSVCFADHLRPRRDSSSQSPLEFTARATRIKPELELDLEGSLIYHGPTSICRIRPHDQLPGDLPLSGLDAKDSQFRQVTEHFGINLDDMLVTESLALFFRWQYPFFMFIYREAFLRDHFGDRSCCKYWSLSLLLSVCAIGVLMKSEADSRETSERFFAAAESIVLVSGLAQPSVTTVQALLCMSFYEIGRGNLSKGWGYSATSGTTILVQCFTEQVHLYEVSRKSLVDSLNLALFRWEASLPEQIRWHRWETASANLLPLIAALHVLYHGVRIVLNLGVSPCAPAAFESESARETCLSSMHDVLSIVRKFRVTYELKHAPLTFVYGLVQAFRASEVLGMVEEGQYALKTLDECSVTWSLARHVQNHNSREK